MPPESVIYVSFESMAGILANQVEQIAYIETKLSFLWVIREHENKTLPSEFLNRLDSNVGLLVPWCNHVDVLSNRAVGCFLTHRGWNSTLEARPDCGSAAMERSTDECKVYRGGLEGGSESQERWMRDCEERRGV
ncbi:UDP-glycosyltransferase 74F2 [Sesamum angolense]|uniref:UDP-glycosyltransferase 74F2 n=1 Tax=Sesamum angolense TaxID=2727404 RepID=A0AAE1WJS9_9LAMI|nr:UDP-glycosyltransferase 74F2 [Sesamum angolense]